MRHFIATALSILAAAQCNAYTPFRCSLISDSKSRTVVQQGEQRYELPYRLSDCEGAKIISGTASVCFIDAQERAVCRPFREGEVVSQDRLVKDRGIKDVALTVLDMLQGDANSGPGVSRGPGRPPGFPYGPVLLLQSKLVLDLSDPALQHVETIEFREGTYNGPVISKIDRSGLVATQDVKPFQPDKRYFWIIHGAAPGLAPQDFTVGSRADVKRARKVLAEIERDRAAGTLGQTVMKAEWLMRQKYAFDATEVLRAAGLELRR